MNICSKAALTLLFATAFLGGCHSAFIQASVTNQTNKGIRLFEVDYPSASFGSQDLASGATFHYRFKVLGEGPAKLTWTDSTEKEHTIQGPQLHEGEEGTLSISIGESTATWSPSLHSAH